MSSGLRENEYKIQDSRVELVKDCQNLIGVHFLFCWCTSFIWYLFCCVGPESCALSWVTWNSRHIQLPETCCFDASNFCYLRRQGTFKVQLPGKWQIDVTMPDARNFLFKVLYRAWLASGVKKTCLFLTAVQSTINSNSSRQKSKKFFPVDWKKSPLKLKRKGKLNLKNCFLSRDMQVCTTATFQARESPFWHVMKHKACLPRGGGGVGWHRRHWGKFSWKVAPSQ